MKKPQADFKSLNNLGQRVANNISKAFDTNRTWPTTYKSKETLDKFKSLSLVDIDDQLKHEMPTLPGSEDWPAFTEYDLTQANQKPVEASTIELGYKIDELEREVLHQKTNFEQLHHANHKLIDEIRDWEIKFKNSEFANRNLQAQVDKIPALKRTIRYMMAEHLDIELGDK